MGSALVDVLFFEHQLAYSLQLSPAVHLPHREDSWCFILWQYIVRSHVDFVVFLSLF